MFDSHSSCRDLYECSHPQLDKLVQLSTNRCSGARLTGAGYEMTLDFISWELFYH